MSVTALAGMLVVISPIAAGALAGVVALLVLLALGRRVVGVFQVALLAILAGYAFLGKGFAYLGAPPLYVGELVLVLALFAIAVRLPHARFHPLHALLALFMLWGLLRTIPYVGTYGIDAPRDAATWYYGLFAIAVSLTVRPRHIELAVDLYRRVVPVFLAWLPVAALLSIEFGDSLPKLPGSPVPFVIFKAGDMAVHEAGVAAFLLLGLYGMAGPTSALREGVLWAAWLVSAGLGAALNRAALLATAACSAVVLFVRASGRWLSLVFVAGLMVTLIAVINPQVDFGGPRQISVGQLVDNLTSVFSDQPNSVNQATKEWRVQWWNTIVNYTVNGPYFWTGKGFGINLADADGFQVTSDGSLRAPHSTHLEILARAGVPGLLLWISFNIAFGLSLLRAAFRAFKRAPAWLPILGWVVVYWLAALIDGSFDVYLGSPQGGIWFWSVVGLGIGVIRLAGAQAPLSIRPGDRAGDGETSHADGERSAGRSGDPAPSHA